MTPMSRYPRVLALAATMVMATALPVAKPAAASCLPLQIPSADAADTVVLVGTVIGVEGVQTTVEVSDWFMGSDRVDTVVIVGGRDPEVITSADWTPVIGDQYAVVATPAIDGTLRTELCLQQLVTPELLTSLRAAYGDPASAATFVIELANSTHARATVDIRDDSGMLLAASSGTPGDGASVEPHQLIVVNETPTTLRLTWVSGPCDAGDSLTVDETGRRLVLVQPECPGDTIVHDRVLLLDFAEPIAASDVQAIVQDGLDTPG